MKKAIKAALHRVGVLGPAQSLYFNLRALTPRVLLDELCFALRGSPDGYPLPPGRLIFAVIACRWRSVYLDSGQRIADDLASLLATTPRPLATFAEVLDFGCGCGRLTRQLPARTQAAIHGTDYNAELIDWCAGHLTFGEFSTNQLLPPTTFAEESVDLILARSVFTHLPEVEQVAWMKEFGRILQPGGYLYLTMHGETMTAGLSEVQKRDFDAGRLVVTYETSAGQNLCSTYASRRYVAETLRDSLALIRHVPGREDPHLRQDVYVLAKEWATS